MGPGLTSVRAHVNDFLKNKLDNYLHKNAATAEELLKKIIQAEKERKAMAGVKKLARERAKKPTFTIKNFEIVVFIITI